ncbi:MAG: hypothetical protein PHO76_02565 [Methylotenera sp.]|nr:hypothetical protein [Methylotenera sp.]
MALYKDLNNNIYDDDNGRAKHLLPSDCVEITEQEAVNLTLPTAAQLAENAKAQALAELATIDASSVRALREYIASKADAPQWLKDKDAAAVLARSKLK